MIDYIPYQEEQAYSNRYAWWALREIENPNSHVSEYAKLITKEYQKLINKEIAIEQFEQNVPKINEDTCLNYIRDCIIYWHPN
jgi:hypothetical protein